MLYRYFVWGVGVALLLISTVGIASADYGVPWNMQQQDNGLWLNVNDQGQNDGWYYERYQSCGCRYYCKCYKYGWRKVKRVVTIPARDTSNFDDKYLDVVYNLTKWKRNDKLIDKLLDYAGDDAVLEGYNEYRTTKTVRRGYGYTANGTTYGNSYYGAPHDDLGFSQHSAERSLDKAYQLIDKLAVKESHRADVALEFQKNLMAYQGFKDMLQVTPQEETTTWEKSGTKSAVRQSASSTNALDDLLVLQGARLNKQDCLKCHSGSEPSKSFDVTLYHLLSPEEIDPTWEVIEGHLDHKLDPGMPHKKPKYSEAKKAAYKAYFYSEAGRSHVEADNQPKLPPLPHPPESGY